MARSRSPTCIRGGCWRCRAGCAQPCAARGARRPVAEDRFDDLGGDDRFDDLGGEREPRRLSAAERLAAGDEAELAAERVDQRRREGPPRPSSAYSWVIGIVFLIAVAVAGAKLLRRRHWTFPVVVDHDGEVSNIYGIGGCPTTVFAARGGIVRSTRLGELSVAQLRTATRRILR